jgi:hypothetical protein
MIRPESVVGITSLSRVWFVSSKLGMYLTIGRASEGLIR